MDVVDLAASARHGCKVCGKSFMCGRSLGGHMRSHISLGEAAALEVHADDELRRASPNGGRGCNGVVGYGLRENPRKTRRLSDFANDEDGGGHGVGDGDGDGERHKACRECGKLFSSWRSLFGHMRSHASGGRDRDDEDDVDVEEEEFVPVPEEAEAEETEMVTPVEPPVAALTVLSAPPRRRRRTMRVAAPAPAPPPPPPVLSGFDKEPEDVALCLLMLSRDTGMWSSPAKEEPFESAEKQAGLPRSGYNSDDDAALLQYGDGDAKKIKGRAAKSSRKRGSGSPKQRRDPVAPKRTRYECPGCGKVFSSYQALGGHRASHKRINASCSSPKVTSAPEPSTETYASFNTLSPSASPDSVAIGFGKSKDDDVELYYVGGAVADHQEQHSAAADGFLDLNFPPAAPEEEEA